MRTVLGVLFHPPLFGLHCGTQNLRPILDFITDCGRLSDGFYARLYLSVFTNEGETVSDS